MMILERLDLNLEIVDNNSNLDNKTYIVAGAANSGKTNEIIRIMKNEIHRKILFFSRESLTDSRILEIYKTFGNVNITFSRIDCDLEYIENELRDNDYDIVIVDNIHTFTQKSFNNDTLTDGLLKVYNCFAKISKETNTAIITSFQTSRETYSHDGKKVVLFEVK